MTKDEALKLALEALDIVKIHFTQNRHVNEALTAIKEALAHPPQRTWVDLTDEEAEDIWEDHQFNDRPSEVSFANRMNLIQAIEAKLRSKNEH